LYFHVYSENPVDVFNDYEFSQIVIVSQEWEQENEYVLHTTVYFIPKSKFRRGHKVQIRIVSELTHDTLFMRLFSDVRVNVVFVDSSIKYFKSMNYAQFMFTALSHHSSRIVVGIVDKENISEDEENKKQIERYYIEHKIPYKPLGDLLTICDLLRTFCQGQLTFG
jgi:hypothetical protein